MDVAEGNLRLGREASKLRDPRGACRRLGGRLGNLGCVPFGLLLEAVGAFLYFSTLKKYFWSVKRNSRQGSRIFRQDVAITDSVIKIVTLIQNNSKNSGSLVVGT